MFTKCLAVAGNGISQAVDSASLLVSCGNSGGACMIVQVKIVGRVIAGPGCYTEET